MSKWVTKGFENLPAKLPSFWVSNVCLLFPIPQTIECMVRNCFLFKNNNFYEQHKGTVVSNPLLSFIAGLFMNTLKQNLKLFWILSKYMAEIDKYVDDIFTAFHTSVANIENFVSNLIQQIFRHKIHTWSRKRWTTAIPRCGCN